MKYKKDILDHLIEEAVSVLHNNTEPDWQQKWAEERFYEMNGSELLDFLGYDDLLEYLHVEGYTLEDFTIEPSGFGKGKGLFV